MRQKNLYTVFMTGLDTFKILYDTEEKIYKANTS